MSAASFIGMAGTLYLQGYDGLAFVMGWTGGYVLVALFLAPYLRKFGQFTIPDFLGARYGGHVPRLIGIIIAILCSFTYVVAQIYAVGLITTRLSGVDFTVGIFLGLAGILVCSFLGGMKAVTWTQVAQYIILIIAYLIPVVWLSVCSRPAFRFPQLVYGQQLAKVTQMEEKAASRIRRRRRFASSSRARPAADEKLKDVPKSPPSPTARRRCRRRSPTPGRRATRCASQGRGADIAAYPKDAEAKAAWTKEKATISVRRARRSCVTARPSRARTRRPGISLGATSWR